MPIKRGRNVKNANANTTGTFSSLSENEAKLSIQQREEDVADFTNAVTKTITSGMRDILRRKKLPGNPYNFILPKIRYKEIEWTAFQHVLLPVFMQIILISMT